MDGSEVLRAVRRRTALSQRALAQRAGVSASAIQAIEAGRRTPTLAVLQAVLDVAGLELAVDVLPPELDARQRGYLRLSLVQRLHKAMGGDGRPRYDRRRARWLQLLALARAGEVHLHGELAVRLWVPSDEPLAVAELCIALWDARRLPDTPDLVVHTACGEHGRAPVVVPVTPWRVLADPPADLALDPRLAAHRPALRAVARTLHVDAARDEGGRRARAHRDPAHEAERHHVFHTKRFGQLAMPDHTDPRAWRLDDDASLAAWLRRHGYPV